MTTQLENRPLAPIPAPSMTTLCRVFLAGKISGPDWRRALVAGGTALYNAPTSAQAGDVCGKCYQEHRCPLVRYSCADTFVYPAPETASGFPERKHVILSAFDYVGPYYLGCPNYGPVATDGRVKYRQTCNCDLTGKTFNHGSPLQFLDGEILRWNQEAIARADLVFAWIDDVTAYATLYELGYAAALKKRIIIAGPRRLPDLNIVYEIGGEVLCAPSPLDAFVAGVGRMLNAPLDRVVVDACGLSPIEAQFYNAWNERNARAPYGDYVGLFPQYPLWDGRYRVDFAYAPKKIAIELDGFQAHSSTDQIAHDRKRQRDIEAAGWRVIRFGGKEVHHNVERCVDEARAIVAQTEYHHDCD